MTFDDLLDLEAIRQLKARYCLLLDAQRWDELRALFTDDATFSVGSGDYESPDAFVDNLRRSLSGELHAHVAQMPLIEKTGLDEARALWIFTNRGAIGHYQDHYRRSAGEWRISRTVMTWIDPPSETLLRTRKGQFAATADCWHALADRWGGSRPATAEDEGSR